MGRGEGTMGYDTPSGARPISPSAGVPSLRQRGFYSELLDAEIDPAQISELAQDASRGSKDPMIQPKHAAPLQNMPNAAQFEPQINDAIQAASERRAKLGASKTGQLDGVAAQGSAPSRALEPKVLVPYNPGPGKTPRKIVIERQKRLFGLQNVGQLLLDLGIDFSRPDSDHPLPLELFDDSEFEVRPVDEWISLSEDGPRGTRYLPALFLWTDPEDGSRTWHDCQVQSYDAETSRFVVLYIPPGSTEMLEAQVNRINLCFRSEDPFNFTRRIAAAHRERAAAAELMRYHLFIECMPTEELTPLEKERVSRMLALALNTERLKEMQLNASSLLSEVNTEYHRTMCSIIFDRLANQAVSTGDIDGIFGHINLPPPPARKPVPEFGMVQIPQHNCLDQRHGFAFHTLLSKREIISCMIKVRTECNKVLSLSLFNTTFTKSVNVEEYEQTQAQTLASTVSNLKDTWSSSLKNAVKTSLKEVGKGWFNLNEKVSSVYAMSKLKRFLKAVNFMMQDSVIYLAEASLNAYANFIYDRCAFEVSVSSPAKVTVKPKTLTNGEKADVGITALPALFGLELVVKDGEGITYRIPPSAFVASVLSVYDKGAASVQDIPQLEKFVMEDLFWSDTPLLQTVSIHEGVTPLCRERFNAAIQAAVPPVEAYLALFDKYLDIVKMDVASYMATYPGEGEGEKTVAVMKEDVAKRLQLAAATEEEIPLSISLGLFYVNTATIRKFISERHLQIAQLILKVIAKRVRSRGDSLIAKFIEASRNLARSTPTIEIVAQLEEYIAQLPAEMEENQNGLSQMMSDQLVLEEFEYSMPDDDFKAFWLALSWPGRLNEEVARVQRICEQKREEYSNAMLSEQDAFQKQLDKLERVVNGFGKYVDLAKVREVAGEVKKLQEEIKEAEGKKALFNKRELIFGLDVTDYSQLTKISKTFEPYAALWTTASNWTTWQQEWHNGPFVELNPEVMEKDLLAAQRTMYKMVKTFADTPGLSDISVRVKDELDAFAPVMPLVVALRNPGMRERHWDELTKQVGMDLNQATDPNFTLTKLKSMNLEVHQEIVTKVCDVAGKEFAIEQAMNKMENEWKGVSLEILPYRETGTYVLKGFDSVQQLLDDHIVMTQSMSFSPFKGPFAQRIEDWEKLLTLMSEIFEEWIKCQRAWMYLEPIFTSDDITRQLPTEGKRFAGVDRTWRKMLGIGFADPDAISFCKTPRLLQAFTDSNQMLELVQKGLAEYLETKRAAFARFYFLSNDELLEILSQSKDPLAVQQHLKKCFENIERLTFQPDLEMTAMTSAEGETVPFKKGIYPNGSVEFWMTDVLNMMKETVGWTIVQSAADYKSRPRGEWVLLWPGATLIAVSGIFWTRQVESCLSRDGNAGLIKYYDQVHGQLMELTTIVSGEITKIQRKSLGALITIDVHARDVTGTMRDNGVSSIQDFSWISQLRYELIGNTAGDIPPSKEHQDGVTLVKQVDAVFHYGNEYLGNSMRLVVTPLTDRIYLTLTGALQLYLGGAPAGPAGTGKTETTKDLAKALAKQCVVFNCQEGLDFLAMAKFFKGLAMSGAWACFDEFNRIDLEVLSVVAQQVNTIQSAMQAGLKRFEFEGQEISLDPANAIFITMNPGYAGRSELPDNLKALFRPVACMVPDYALIAEIRLYSFGYRDARRLSQKMVKTFQLSSEQLSSQDHYDFGMRAVNTVIQAAGNNRQANPDMEEDLLVLSALADSNRPKFLAEDMVLFNSIMSDLFPKKEVPKPDYSDLIERISHHCKENKKIPTEAFLFKCIQVYEVSVLRHGLMTVGPAGGGKTTAKHMLHAAMGDLDGINEKYSKVRRWILNPKAITMGQLYGEFDENTHEWTDGVLCVLYRAAVKEFAEFGKTDRNWLVFDGPVDALWIESMNTVLDDNRKLCLVSGEIIAMSPYMNMVFEVEDLAVASPATVSRVGTIFMEPEKVVGTASQLESWLMGLNPVVMPYREKLSSLLTSMCDPLIETVRRTLREYVPTVDNNLMKSTLNVLHQFWTQFIPVDGIYEVPSELSEALPNLIEKLVFFSLVWGIGASTDTVSRKKFDLRIRELAAECGLNDALHLPDDGLVYDYAVDVMENKWQPWMQTIPEYKLKATTAFEDIIVPTVDSVRYMWVLEQLVVHDFHVLCVGPTGTGKTLSVADKLMRGMPEKYSPVFVGFSAQTSANQTQDLLDSKLDKRRKGIFAPPPGKKYAIFVDDVNMPQRETYGAQPPIEILRFWMGHGGWYDRKTQEFRNIVDICFVGAMGPPGGGRSIVTNRFLRYFNFIAFPELEDSSMRQIFSIILETWAEAYLPADCLLTTEPLVSATLELYNTLLRELLPTPAKSHYTFNLRDIASVVQGILSAGVKQLQEPPDLIRLWVHESLRVYRDRLVNNEDREWFDEQMRRLVPKHFELAWDDVVAVPTTQLLYGDFMVPGADPRVYAEITDVPRMISTVEEYLEDYNAQNTKKMPLVMFVDAVSHVARISRVLRQPGGNCLLLGVGGSGRQSLSRLATAIADYECFQIEITKSYGKHEWREDLKRILLKTGEEGKDLTFLFSDTQIVKEYFLEDVNNILNSGEVPNLLDENDETQIINTMRPLAQAAGEPLTKVAMHSFFVKRIKQHIHLIICMSPLGEAFRTRLRNFPSLVNNCTIDYFAEWPEEALRSVAKSTLDTIDMGTESVQEGIVQMCGQIHQTVEASSKRYLDEQRRYNYVTPTSYLEVLSTFKTLLAQERDRVSNAKRRLVIGLDKLSSTEVEVDELKRNLEEMQPVLIATSKDVEMMMEQIEVDKSEADKTREVVMKEEEVASVKAAQCQEIKESAEKDLAEALPALDAAVAVLRNLKLSDLAEVAKYTNPPAGCKLTMEAMCVLKQVPPKKVGAAGSKVDDYWEPGKKMLQDAKGLLDSMFNFDKDNIPPKVIEKLQPYINNEEFTPKKIESASKACTAMCQWVRAMDKYHHVALEVEPKRQALKASQEELDVLTANLNQLRAQLKEVEDKINELERKFNEAVAKKEELAAKVADATVKQDRAGRLLGGLGGEKVRWKATVVAYTQQEGNLVGDICLASGYVAYLGPFTAEYRNSLANDWRAFLESVKVPHSEGANLIKVMADPVKLRKWQVDGLPADSVSTENGIILACARRWPLCIDPQGQANKWIKKMEEENQIEASKPSDKDFLRSLENAVRFGKPVVMENVLEGLDPALEPILLKQVFKQGGNVVIKIGDNVIPYHQDFRFFMTSKLPNPHYTPETSVKVTLLNFTITQEGLEDQLLGITVAKERPDLEETKNNLVVSNARMAAQLKDIESQILRLLSESQGNILDDENLINTLAQSKVTSNEIEIKAAEAAETEVVIDKTREEYRPVAFHAALLFFCVADMGSVNDMYQYSMPWFVQLFIKAIEDSEKTDVLTDRLKILADFFTYLLYENICRSLFEAHKMLFSFTVCIKIMQGKQLIDPDEWRFFLSGSSGSSVIASNPSPDWITERVWGALTSLAKLPAFEGIALTVSNELSAWRAYFDSNDTHEAPLPGKWNDKLTLFQGLCVLRCIRPDKVVQGMQRFIAANLEQRFIEPPSLSLDVCFKDSTNLMPLVFVLSPGADPYENLMKLAESMRFSKKVSAISLGQGQGPLAERMMSAGMERGTWVLLQNCHLSASWMPRLEAFVEQYDPEVMHRDYRLWLTSMPSPAFPVSILQNSVKMTQEPPRGVKANLAASYIGFTDAYFEKQPKQVEFKKLLYGTCFFHALLQDRRKFGPLGFNIRYEFTTGDLKCCILQLENFLARYDEVPYEVLVNLIGHINYGGRITDDWDRRCVLVMLKSIINPSILDDDMDLAPGGLYKSLHAGKVTEYRNNIAGLPLNPHPNIFGLHENADIACANNETQELCDIMLSLQPKVSSGSGKSRDDAVREVAMALQERHLKPFDMVALTERYPLTYEESMNTVLSQEAVRFNKLIVIYNRTIADLLKALKGLVVMSGELEAMADALYTNQVPTVWSTVAYPSLKPLAAWVEDLIQRINFIADWERLGAPAAFWVSGFFFPQAFLTGTLQNFARKYAVAIDSVSFGFTVMKQRGDEISERPNDGCYIYGCFLEGAGWDSEAQTLVEAKPKELFVSFPAIWLEPVVDRAVPTSGIYSCPMYKTLTRAGTLSTTGHSTNFVLMVEIPSSDACSGLFHKYCEGFSCHWIKRAVALFTSLNY